MSATYRFLLRQEQFHFLLQNNNSLFKHLKSLFQSSTTKHFVNMCYFSQYEYTRDLFLGSCPVGHIRLNRIMTVAFGLDSSLSVKLFPVACGGNILLLSIKMSLCLEQAEHFSFHGGRSGTQTGHSVSPVTVCGEPVLEIMGEIKMECAELGGSHSKSASNPKIVTK